MYTYTFYVYLVYTYFKCLSSWRRLHIHTQLSPLRREDYIDPLGSSPPIERVWLTRLGAGAAYHMYILASPDTLFFPHVLSYVHKWCKNTYVTMAHETRCSISYSGIFIWKLTGAGLYCISKDTTIYKAQGFLNLVVSRARCLLLQCIVFECQHIQTDSRRRLTTFSAMTFQSGWSL